MPVPINGPVAYQIAVTYRCNAACKWCVQHLDVIRWKCDTDVTVEEVIAASKILKKYNITIGKLRVTGGEPCIHPKLEEICVAIGENWTPRTSWYRIYSNGKLPLPKRVPGRFSVVPLNSIKKMELFTPFNVSPADLGIEPILGFTQECAQQVRCGRWFDHFGFTSCGVAGVLGTMLGDDCYEPLPVMMGRPSVCQHCLFSLPRVQRHAIARKVNEGKIPDVTPTFERAIERWRDDPPSPRTFWERLPKELTPGENGNGRPRGLDRDAAGAPPAPVVSVP